VNGFDDLSGLSVFVRIVEEGSLSGAARAMDVPKATLSRQLAQLEKRLGTQLVLRSTRALSLTDAGRRYFEQVQPLVHAAHHATADLRDRSAGPSGLLRVAASVAYGQAEVAPRLVGFMWQHPAVRIELRLSDDRVSVVGEGFDLVIRMGRIEDSDLVCRKLADIPMVLVASPAWITRHGMPRTVAALSELPAVVTRPDLLHWTVGGEQVRVSWRMSTGNMLVTRDAVLAGLGMAMIPAFLVSRHLAAGELLQLLPEMDIPATQATALYARSGTRSASVKALIECLASPLSISEAVMPRPSF
jgi:DNA-binding transcriptional LysR family regulator